MESRHWLRHPIDGSIRVIDFDIAKLRRKGEMGTMGVREGKREGEDDSELDIEMEGENHRVKDLLIIKTR